MRVFAQWAGIGGAVFGVLSFCLLVTIWVGPLRAMSTGLERVTAKLDELDVRLKALTYEQRDRGPRSVRMDR